MPPRSTHDPIPRDPVHADAPLSYGINARLDERQAQYLNALKRDLGLGTSAAVREAIDRAMAGQEGEASMFHAGQLEVLSARAEPDLGHVEIKIMRPAPDEPGASDVMLLHLSAQPALDFLEQLATAVQTLDQTAGPDA